MHLASRGIIHIIHIDVHQCVAMVVFLIMPAFVILQSVSGLQARVADKTRAQRQQVHRIKYFPFGYTWEQGKTEAPKNIKSRNEGGENDAHPARLLVLGKIPLGTSAFHSDQNTVHQFIHFPEIEGQVEPINTNKCSHLTVPPKAVGGHAPSHPHIHSFLNN